MPFTLTPHMHSLPHHQYSSIEQDLRYDPWPCLGPSTSPRVHRSHQDPLVVLYSLWVWTNGQRLVSALTVSHRTVHYPKNCALPIHLPFSTPGNHLSACCFHRSAFSRTFGSWNHMAQHAALRDWLLSRIRLSMHLGSSMSFHGFKAGFFLVLKNTELSGWTTVYLSITY